MLNVLHAARRTYQKNRHIPAKLLLRRSVVHLWQVATAPLHLMFVNEVGRGVRTYGKPRIENLGFMSIGSHTLLRSVGVPVELATGVGARLMIGSEVTLGHGVSVGCTGSILIGNRVRMGAYVMIVDTDFHDPYNRAVRPAPSPVTIEDDVWIGAKASILPGVHVGRGAIIGSGAVVTKDVAPFAVVSGVPAKVIRTLDPDGHRPQEIT